MPDSPAHPRAPTRKPGVFYARTAQDIELPVIDVSHPAFRVADDAQSLQSLRQTYAQSQRRSARLPRFLLRYLIRSAVKRSMLARAMFEPQGAVLPGMSTYLIKLGSDNLMPPFDGEMDRRFTANPGAISMRLRLQQTARLLAQGLEAELALRPGATLHLLNIGGGSAVDSLNTLILLCKAAPALMQRAVVVRVLDPDTGGPLFAARALASLSSQGGPLAGLDARLVHTAYNWNDPEPLRELVRDSVAEGAVVAASSEGALFEYGSDAAVIANLQALHAGGQGARLIAGSVTRGDDMTRRMLQMIPFKLVPRGALAFATLIRGSGFSVARVEEALVSDQVLLRTEVIDSF